MAPSPAATRTARRHVDHGPIAQPEELDTDSRVTRNLNAVIRDRHKLAQMRRVPVIGVDSPSISGTPAAAVPPARHATGAVAAPAADTVVELRPGMPTTATSAPVTTIGAPSTLAVAFLDSGHRFAATKVTDRLGWQPGCAIVAAIEPGKVTLGSGQPTRPSHHQVTFDARKQLRIGPTAIAALGLGAGGQVLAIATATGEMVLVNAAAVAEVITGVIRAPEAARPAQPEPAPAPAARSSVTKRWQPPVDNACSGRVQEAIAAHH